MNHLPSLHACPLLLAVEIDPGFEPFRVLVANARDLAGARMAAGASGTVRELGLWVLPPRSVLDDDTPGLVWIANAWSVRDLHEQVGGKAFVEEVLPFSQWIAPEHPSYAQVRRVFEQRLAADETKGTA